MFKGSFVAIITPFKNGEIDVGKLKELIDFLIQNGSAGIVPCGTTGESATLSHEEHKKVIKIVIEHTAGRAKVIAGTGSNNTAEAIELTKFAYDAGADGALLITPYYNKPTPKGLYSHFKEIAKNVALPIILYNVPGRTGVNMLPETVAQLAKIENIVGIKEASGNIQQVQEIIRLCREDFVVLSGEDALTFPMLCLGAKGVISVVANLVPHYVSEMVKEYENGNFIKARELHYFLLPLMNAMFLETNPIPVKTSLAMMGIASDEMRLPLTEMGEENKEKLRKILQEYRIIEEK